MPTSVRRFVTPPALPSLAHDPETASPENAGALYEHSVSGKLRISNGSEWANVGGVGFAALVGNGVDNEFNIVHGLGTADVIVMLRSTSSPYEQVVADTQPTNEDTVTIRFSWPPDTDQYRVVVIPIS